MKHFGPLQPAVDYLLNAWHERAVLLKAISFAMVGVINVSVDIGMFTFFYGVLHAADGLVTLEETVRLIVANTLSWAVAVTGSYVMNSYFTFAHETGRELKLRAYAAFVMFSLAGLLVNTTVLVVGAKFMPVWGAKGLATLASFMVNFSMSHFVIFRQRTPRPSDVA